MTANSLEIDTEIFYAPGVTSGASGRVNSSISFYQLIDGTSMRTLSPNINTIATTSPAGVLYVPSIATNSSCYNASAPYVPQNVTRKQDAPVGINLIAIAPWVSAECTKQYLAMGRYDLVRSFLFFIPGQGNSLPPNVNDPAWDLNDGGNWKKDNQYPVYAITSNTGAAVMTAIDQYSGNLQSIPNSAQIATDPRNTVRVVASLALSATTGLPSLWIFLIIILAVLVIVVGFTSMILHFLQRRRRNNLRRRIANGEVDIESLGIKRLLIPRDVLVKMPVFTYEASKAASEAAPGSDSDQIAPKEGTKQKLDQPSCAVCLDDFVDNETQVRQLPCGHIYHPECIDSFLMEHSSLCPLCKKSSLPPGYCPENITNVMVRRERLMQRARARGDGQGTSMGPVQIVTERGRHFLRVRRDENQDMEMGTTPPGSSAGNAAAIELDPTTATPPPPTQRDARRRWLARRAEAMLGPHAAPREVDEGRPNVPRWRGIFGRAFPTR